MVTRRATSHWLYATLFGTQTLGAIILFWYGVPLYRRVLADPSVHQAELAALAWSLPSILLMQVGHWIGFRLRPPLPKFFNPVIGHIVLFLGRFAFVVASGVFTFMFLAPKPNFSVPISRYVITIFGVFSIFCYTLELDRFGRALLGPETKSS